MPLFFGCRFFYLFFVGFDWNGELMDFGLRISDCGLPFNPSTPQPLNPSTNQPINSSTKSTPQPTTNN